MKGQVDQYLSIFGQNKLFVVYNYRVVSNFGSFAVSF